jgi:hypothetical protein
VELLVGEIGALWRLYQSMRVCWVALISDDHGGGSARGMVGELVEMQTRSETRGAVELENLDNRLDFMERKVFADGRQGAGELKTRVVRIIALDVEPELRTEERERRFKDPDAIEYSSWPREDLNFLRAW